MEITYKNINFIFKRIFNKNQPKRTFMKNYILYKTNKTKQKLHIIVSYNRNWLKIISQLCNYFQGYNTNQER